MNTGTTTSASTPPIDFKYAMDRAKLIMTNPTNCWDSLATEQITLKDLFMKYAVILAAIPAICSFIGLVVIGVQMPFVGTWHAPVVGQLVGSIVGYVAALAGIYVGALVLQQISPKFGGSSDLVSGAKLLAFSMTPTWVAGVLSLIPMLGLLSILFSLYGLYLFYQGSSKLLALPENKKLVFTVVSIIAIFVVNLVIGIVVGIATPHPMMNLPS